MPVVLLATPVQFGDALVLVLYLALILGAAYFVTKYIARAYGGRGKAKNKRGPGRSFFQKASGTKAITIVDRVNLDKEKSFVVIAYEGTQYLILITGNGARVLKTSPVSEDAPKDDEAGSEAKAPGQGEEAPVKAPDLPIVADKLMGMLGKKGAKRKNGGKEDRGEDFSKELESVMSQRRAGEPGDGQTSGPDDIGGGK